MTFETDSKPLFYTLPGLQSEFGSFRAANPQKVYNRSLHP